MRQPCSPTANIYSASENMYSLRANIYSAWANKIKFTYSSIKQKHIQEKNRLAFYLGPE